MHGLVSDVVIAQAHAAAIGVHKAGNHVETSGFTCTVWAK